MPETVTKSDKVATKVVTGIPSVITIKTEIVLVIIMHLFYLFSVMHVRNLGTMLMTVNRKGQSGPKERFDMSQHRPAEPEKKLRICSRNNRSVIQIVTQKESPTCNGLKEFVINMKEALLIFSRYQCNDISD